MKAEAQKDVDHILTENRRVVDQALDRGIRKAMLRHRRTASQSSSSATARSNQ
jgi:hypothetical protein